MRQTLLIVAWTPRNKSQLNDTSNRLPELLTVEVLAQKWHLKPGTIRTWARRGQIPSRKMGRLLVFDVRELAQWYSRLPSGAVTNRNCES